MLGDERLQTVELAGRARTTRGPLLKNPASARMANGKTLTIEDSQPVDPHRTNCPD
jgi:hypothetical protein